MIVSLSSEFDAFKRLDWLPYIPSIENLLIAHLAGWHMFVPSRQVVESLLELNQLSERHKLALSVQISERLAVLHGQAATVSRRILCFPEGSMLDDEDNSLIQIPLNNFSIIDNCFKSVLLIENPDTDGAFYLHMAKTFGAAGSMKLPLSLEASHGGGHTTAARVKKLVAEPRPCLILVDGDQTYPGGPEGDTAKQVRIEFAKSAFKVHQLKITEVKAVENFVPTCLGVSCLSDRPESLKVAVALERLTQEEISIGIDMKLSMLAFLNYKKGIKVSSYRKSCQDFRDSVNRFLSYMGITWHPPADNDTSRDDEQVCFPVNKRFIEIFSDSLRDPEFSTQCETVFPMSPYFEHLQEIINEIVAFGIAAQRAPYSLSAVA